MNTTKKEKKRTGGGGGDFSHSGKKRKKEGGFHNFSFSPTPTWCVTVLTIPVKSCNSTLPTVTALVVKTMVLWILNTTPDLLSLKPSSAFLSFSMCSLYNAEKKQGISVGMTFSSLHTPATRTSTALAPTLKLTVTAVYSLIFSLSRTLLPSTLLTPEAASASASASASAWDVIFISLFV